ncbi:hypothetical protein YC2023_089382 [Brassica napus]
MISSSNPVSPPVTIGFSKSSVCLKATVSFTIFSLVHYNLSHCTTSRVQNFATASALPFAPHLCFVTNFCRRHSPSLASCLAGLSVTIYSSDIETAITCQGVYGAKQNRPDLSPSPPAEMTHQQWPCLPPHLGKVPLVTTFWDGHGNVEFRGLNSIKPSALSSNFILSASLEVKLEFEIYLVSSVSFVGFKRGRGRGGFGVEYAKAEPFVIFPDITLPDRKSISEDKQFNDRFDKFWKTSIYHLGDGPKNKKSHERGSFYDYLVLRPDNFPKELLGDTPRERPVKRAKWTQDADLHKLEVLEKLEAKLKAEGKEEKKEGVGDDEAEECEGEDSDNGDYDKMKKSIKANCPNVFVQEIEHSPIFPL